MVLLINFVSSLLHTNHFQCCQCCVGLQCLAQCACSFITDVCFCLIMLLRLNPRACFAFFCCGYTPARFSDVSVVLVFSASPSAHAPLSPISSSVFVVMVRATLNFVLSLLRANQFQCFQSCVGLQCLAQSACSFITDAGDC